jgi:hypothetical protein
MRRRSPVLIPSLLLAAALGCHHPRPSPAASSPIASPAVWVTQTPPPAAYPETQPPQPHKNDVWVPGWFKWDGKSFEWVVGRWETPPSGTHEWAPGAWSERSDGKWQFIDGHWQ